MIQHILELYLDPKTIANSIMLCRFFFFYQNKRLTLNENTDTNGYIYKAAKMPFAKPSLQAFYSDACVLKCRLELEYISCTTNGGKIKEDAYTSHFLHRFMKTTKGLY